MKSANPHTAHVDRQHRGEPRHHLFGGFVGEGHRHHAARGDLAGLQEPSDTRGQHTGFARASTRQNKGVAIGQSDCGQLFRIKVIQQTARVVGEVCKMRSYWNDHFSGN